MLTAAVLRRDLFVPLFLWGVSAPLPVDQASLPVDEVNFSPHPPF